MEADITFCMIVLNGEPFVRYNLCSLYPFAQQIIVVEGACSAAAAVARSDGHSQDGTLDALRRFKKEDDPEDKITIVTAEDEGHPDGFWPGEKDEMSQAYAKRASGHWLWQVDVDEFYIPHDMERIVFLLHREPQITQVSFVVKTFSGSPAFLVDGFYLRGGANVFRRIFAWRPSYRYVRHRPPTVIDDRGQSLERLHPVSAKKMARQGIFLYHYEQLFPKQVREKCSYYSRVGWSSKLEGLDTWATECFLTLSHPYRVHMVYRFPSWYERYHAAVPPVVLRMVEAVKLGEHASVELRRSQDIEDLLSSPLYSLGRSVLKACSILYSVYLSCRRLLGRCRRRDFKQAL